MKNLSMTLFGAFLIFSTAMVFASDDPIYEGGLAVEGRYVDQQGASAFLNKYKDIDDDIFGSFWWRAYDDDWFLDMEGSNISLDDQSYKLNAGKHESFKFFFLYDEIPNMISPNARTFYHGIGGDTLTYAAVNRAKDTDLVFTPNIPTNPAAWKRFDYEEERRKVGVGVELSMDSPYFFKARFTEDRQDGTRPHSVGSSVYPDIMNMMVSQFGTIIEMPAPVDYITYNTILEAGYNSEKLHIKVSGISSQFENGNDTLTWRNPYVTTEQFYEKSSLAPDNNFYRLSGQASLKLPGRSVIALRCGYSKGTSDSDIDPFLPFGTDGIGPPLAPPIMSPIYGITPVFTSSNDFQGEVTHENASITFRSLPTKSLDLNFYYRYLNRINESSVITFWGINPEDPTEIGSVVNNPYSYRKHNAGVDAGYRFPLATKMTIGYDFSSIDRDEVPTAANTTDHEVYLELLNRFHGQCTWKIRYAHLERTSDFQLSNAGANLFDPASIARFTRYYDSTDKSSDAVKLDVTLQAAENLDLGFQYKYERDDYDKTILGLTGEDRHEVYLDAFWEIPKRIKLSGSIGYERENFETDQRYVDDLPAPPVSTYPGSGTWLIPDPLIDFLLGRDVTAYNWGYEESSDFWSFAINSEIPIVKNKLDLVAWWKYQIYDGELDFSSDGVEPLGDIDHLNDYHLSEVNLKFVYKATKSWKVIMGYAFQRFYYEDIQTDGYQFVSTDTNLNRYFLSGVNAENIEENNIIYMGIAYQF